MADYIPQSDADFHLFQGSLVTIVQAGATTWGILAADVTALAALQTTWNSSFAKASNKQNRTAADMQAKDDAREAYEKALRAFVAQWLANNTKVPNSEREHMGITVKSKTHTAVSVPSTRPVSTQIDFSVRLQHTIHYVDEATPQSKAKPEGVHGCEIWCKIDGAAPTDASELSFLGTNTRTLFETNFTGKDAGKTVYYWLRWVNTRGEQGPWSSTYSATIVG